MKPWTFTGLIAGFLMLALAVKRTRLHRISVVRQFALNTRYDIDDFISDDSL